MVASTKTIKAQIKTSFMVGQVTFDASCFTPWANLNGLNIFLIPFWQERRESNPQPPVLETGALPIELPS